MATNAEKPDIERQEAGLFFKNVMTLVSGSAMAQIITIAASPLITRLYSPDEFGVFGVYASIISILALFSSFRYELAIMLPEKNEDAQSLLYLSVIVLSFMCLLFMGIIFFFNDFIAGFLNFKEKHYLFFIPLSAFFAGLIRIFTTWSSRNKCFEAISKSKVFSSGSKTIFHLFFSSLNILGLIGGNIIGGVIQICILFYRSLKSKIINIRDFSVKRVLFNAKRYKDFAIYPLIAGGFKSLSGGSMIIFLAMLYSPEIAGFYALSCRVLVIPLELIKTSVAEVSYQKASQLFNEKGDLKNFYKKTTFGLLKVSFLPFLVLLFFAPQIFNLTFGNSWITAGIFVQINAIAILTAFINPAASITVNVLEIHKFRVFYQAVLFILSISGILTGYFIFNSAFYSVAFFAVANAVCALFQIIYVYRKI